jgi:glycine/sarcosine N-methyltransferase
VNKLLARKNFYDELASEYDEMISFETAIEKKKILLKSFINQNSKSAADIGCGSGVDSIALALSGLKVVAFDPSSKMLKAAELNSKRMNVQPVFHNSTADKIPNEFDDNFDLVLSLGNTFANISNDKLQESIQRCYDILKPEGQLLIQILNYEKILVDKNRIVNITEGKNKFFIRFYDFNDEQIIFNILTFAKNKISDYKLSSTEIHPYFLDDFKSGLRASGFNDIKFYGDLRLAEFVVQQSKDLIVISQKK